jgi:hypothetical protein
LGGIRASKTIDNQAARLYHVSGAKRAVIEHEQEPAMSDRFGSAKEGTMSVNALVGLRLRRPGIGAPFGIGAPCRGLSSGWDWDH